MKHLLLLIAAFLPTTLMASIPAIEDLGERASNQDNVEHTSVGSFMLSMASSFAKKEQRKTFKMLNNIELIECHNHSYCTTLESEVKSIIKSLNASYIGTTTDDRSRNVVYGLSDGEIINELIILAYGHKGSFSVIAISGEIPHDRLEEISQIRQPLK